MKPLLRAVLIVDTLVTAAFALLLVATPWASLYGALQLVQVSPAMVGQLFGVVLLAFAWLQLRAAISGARGRRQQRCGPPWGAAPPTHPPPTRPGRGSRSPPAMAGRTRVVEPAAPNPTTTATPGSRPVFSATAPRAPSDYRLLYLQ